MTTVLIIVAIAIIALLAYAATRPSSFRLQRSISIDATSETIAPFIADFHKWQSWSPWEGLDPNLKRSFSGSATGRGAIYAYDGDKKVGAGRMEILESSPQRILVQLDFIRPFKANNKAEFSLTPSGETTTVTWAMFGPQPFMNKLMSIFLNFDKMIGPDFERGLAKLKDLAERQRA